MFVTICSSLITASVHAGLGRHSSELAMEQQLRALKLSVLASPFGIMAYSLPNVSVAIFLDRILFPDPLRKWFIYSVVIAQNVAAAVAVIMLFFHCATPPTIWHGRCFDPLIFTNYSYFLGGMIVILCTAVPNTLLTAT